MFARSLIRFAVIAAALFGLVGISPVGAQTDGPAATDGATTPYIVHPGDTLYRIAVNHNVTVAQIAQANNIRNANFVYAGQRLMIPDATPQVIVNAPVSGQQLGSPITVTGIASTFEGVVVVEVRDSRWRVIGRGQGLAAMGEYIPFTITVPYTVTTAQVGYVDVFGTSGKDDSKLDMVTVAVTLRATGTAPACRATYGVKRGDWLASIARQYGTTVSALVRANGIFNPNVIYVGQRLCIP
jgi:lysozyme